MPVPGITVANQQFCYSYTKVFVNFKKLNNWRPRRPQTLFDWSEAVYCISAWVTALAWSPSTKKQKRMSVASSEGAHTALTLSYSKSMGEKSIACPNQSSYSWLLMSVSPF